MKPTLVLLASFYWCSTNMVQAQNTIYGYAVGNWRHGPVVELSPLFTTTESFTTPQLVAWVRKQWPASFTDTTDIDVLRFATVEEGKENRATLHAKYGQRKLACRAPDRSSYDAAHGGTARGHQPGYGCTTMSGAVAFTCPSAVRRNT